MSATIFVLLLSSYVSAVHVGGVREEYLDVDLLSQLPSAVCSPSNKEGNVSSNVLKVIPRYGPCSAAGGVSSLLLIRKLLDEDELRVESIQRKLLGNSSRGAHPQLPGSQVSIPARSGLALGSGNYVVTFGLGTPSRPQTVIFDTGSTVSWIQCKPCLECHRQKEPIFDPAASSTYRNLSCSSRACVKINQGGCESGRCPFFILYGDGSQTSGYLSQDTLALTKSDAFPGFVFGCANTATGIFGREAGLFGLSRDPFSLVSQTLTKYGSVFSYCLPSLSSSTGDLTFGPVSDRVRYTTMLTNPRAPSFYYVQFTGISVAGRLLPISPNVFSAGRTLLDSGTVITRLPKTAYLALRAAFQSRMKQYKAAKPLSILDTCYDFTGVRKVKLPAVTLHFGGGVTVPLAFRGIMFIGSVSQTCLAFAATDGTGVIGNTQQVSLRVVHDLGRKRIGFGPGSCR